MGQNGCLYTWKTDFEAKVVEAMVNPNILDKTEDLLKLKENCNKNYLEDDIAMVEGTEKKIISQSSCKWEKWDTEFVKFEYFYILDDFPGPEKNEINDFSLWFVGSKPNPIIDKVPVSNDNNIFANKDINCHWAFGSDINPFIIKINDVTQRLSNSNIVSEIEATTTPLDSNFAVEIYASPLSLPLRSMQGVCRINSEKMLFTGGKNTINTKSTKKSWLFDLPSMKAIPVKKMNQKRFGHYCITVKGIAYVLGGQDVTLFGKDIMTCECYSILKDEWTAIAKFNYERINFLVFSYNDTLYITGGSDSKNTICLNSFERYDPVGNIWSIIHLKLPTKIKHGDCVVSNEKIYIVGGCDESLTPLGNVSNIDIENGMIKSYLPMSDKKYMVKVLAMNGGFVIIDKISDGVEFYPLPAKRLTLEKGELFKKTYGILVEMKGFNDINWLPA